MAPGLAAEVEILVDRWGVPHIYAENFDDVFFAQGWNAARDRLWQLDLWKRRGDGTLSEVLGSEFIEKDRAARLFLFRGDMHAEWLAYASDTKRIVTAFVAGINAYIERTREDPDLLPFEFRELDYQPALWTPETVVRIRSHGLLWNAREEASRARFVRDHGLSALRYRELLTPSHEVAVPEGLDLSVIPDEVIDVYNRARSGVRLARDDSGQLTLASIDGDPVGDGAEQPLRSASNNWAVSAARSASGRAMLANDPHRAISVPSLRYIAHLSAPGLDVIGAGEPALPGLSIGHNKRVAFGLTIFFIDQEDLYVYATRPGKPHEYRYRDRWEPMQVITERIRVRDAPDVDVKLAYTRHGPVMYADPDENLAIGLRAAWLQPGMAPYLGSILSMRAQNWDDFLAAMNRWGLPPENLLYADVEGRIGWKPGGLAPIRPNWDGLLPVPGDGRYEWAGFRNMDELPVEHDPPRGWVATANQMNLPPDYPHELGFEWILPYRFERIREVLAPKRLLTFEDMLTLQRDTRSVPAQRVLRHLAGISSDDPRAQRALALLRGWDGDLRADSAAAALYEVWAYRHLARAVMADWIDANTDSTGKVTDATGKVTDVTGKATDVLDKVTNEKLLYDVFEGSSAEVWLSRLEDVSLSPTTRRALLLESLAAATSESESLLGSDWSSWRWGRLHRAELEHPISPLLGAAQRAKANVGPAPRGGSGATVNSTAYTLEDFIQRYGASFRMLLDVGDWDESVAMNTPGQSGDPGSPHYQDLFESWARDESFPLLYSRERIQEATQQRILLQPDPAPSDARP